MQIKILPFLFLSLMVFVSGCASRSRSYTLMRTPSSTAINLQAGELTVEQLELIGQLCPFGQPKLGSFYDSEPITLIVRDGYAMAHNDLTKTPVWVCENVRKEDVHGSLTGRGDWAADPILCESNAHCTRGSVDSDYRNSGYDRGHLAPNWNQRRNSDRKDATFFFSNAAPQIGKDFNRSKWQALERKLTEVSNNIPSFWTITGVLYSEDGEVGGSNNDGFISVETIGNGSVHVPTHFYKIIVWEDAGPKAFAVVMKNREYADDESYSDEENLKSIRWIEDQLDVDFMPNLDPGEADDLETVIGEPFP